ncbi:hypothetical protein A2U01_0052767 [Trifolium medium]|uniref:Secreted protein n=1 Tax=Trifolium medium TaxID=97028 RepID=A0A392R7N5_9FABA|nr:hypothetical protein [Trifolium medium]
MAVPFSFLSSSPPVPVLVHFLLGCVLFSSPCSCLFSGGGLGSCRSPAVHHRIGGHCGSLPSLLGLSSLQGSGW